MPEPQLIRCPACGTTNRVPKEKLDRDRKPVCGRCHAALPITTKPVEVTDASFLQEVERSPLPVLLDLWAPWCGPCRMVSPVVGQLAAQMAGRLRVAKMNVDENPVTAGRFQIQSIPTLLLLQGGREIDRIVGALPKSEIERRLARALDALQSHA